MQLTSLLVCLMAMAPVVIQAAPLPSNDASLDSFDDILFPEEALELVKRVTTTKPVAKPAAAKPVAAKPVAAKPVAAKPVAAPVKAPAKAAPAPAKAAPANGSRPASPVDVCAGVTKRGLARRAAPCKCFKKCNSCTANPNCAFSTVTFTCVDKGNGSGPADSIISSEAAQKCPAVQQQTGIFPVKAVQGQPDTIAGLPTPQIKAEFAKIKPHVFTLESAQRPDSGQHLKSVWLATHKTGPKSIAQCNAATGLCKFNDGSATGKTVWDDSTGVYTKQDVENMCSVALALTIGARTATEVNHVVLTPLNVKICVQATKQGANFNAATGAGQGSCFPVGTAAATGLVHSAC